MPDQPGGLNCSAMTENQPYPDARLDYPATGRNRDAILEILERVLPETGSVLEVASGSGQHIAWFAKSLTHLDWQPSDADTEVFPSIEAWTAHEGVEDNVNPPLLIDGTMDIWPVGGIKDLNAITCINMIHIAPWVACLGLLKNAGRILPAGGILYLYGPYMVGGQHTASSNAAFDQSLKSRDPDWGIRNLDDVAETALMEGFQLTRTVRMPANNLSVVFQRKG